VYALRPRNQVEPFTIHRHRSRQPRLALATQRAADNRDVAVDNSPGLQNDVRSQRDDLTANRAGNTKNTIRDGHIPIDSFRGADG
jgi:hypothetical protein